MTKIGVLVSGAGTNLQAIVDATHSGILREVATVAVVLSSQASAGALARARSAGIAAEFVPPSANYDDLLLARMNAHHVDLVCLAGFMRIVGPTFLAAFPERVLNIHPALLPSFPGLDAQRCAWEQGVKFSGATVHFVDEGVDTGPIILQAVVPVLDDDDPGRLRARILAEEHRIYPEAIRLVCQNRLTRINRRVLIRDAHDVD